jgi:methyl-accepting chemotaxis protein
MDKFKISSRLYILLAFAAAAFCILLLVTEWGIAQLNDAENLTTLKTAHSNEVQASANIGSDLYQVIADAIINRDLVASAQDWAAAKADSEKLLARAQEIADTPEEKQKVEKADQAYRELVRTYEASLLPLLQADKELKEIRALDHIMDAQVRAIDADLKPFSKALAAEAEEADKQFDVVRSRISSLSKIAAVVLLALMVAISLYISKGIIRQLGGEPSYAMEVTRRIAAGDLTTSIAVDQVHGQSLMSSIKGMQEQLAQLIQKISAGATQVSSAARELAAASAQVSASSEQQSESTASVAAAVEELTVSIDQVSHNASEAEKIAADSGKRSDQGATQVREATEEMTRIADAVQETTAQMATLTEQSQQIGSIANVIKEVADQTNLLALNAAIEAARAGEQGRGFAVVADEVRKLAERTTASAQEITAMIASIQSHTDQATATMQRGNQRVEEGVELAKRAGESMQSISSGSMGVVHAVTDISNALKEQKTVSNEIAQRVENISQMTEENSMAVSTVAATAGQLNSLADDLQQAVSRFRV